MNSSLDLSPEPPNDLRRICPFLGVQDDPDTSLAFACAQNYCHCAVPASPPKLDHQLNRCLTASFAACPVYSAREKRPLPAGVRMFKPNTVRIAPPAWLFRVGGASLVAVVIFLTGWFGVKGLSRSLESSPVKTRIGLPALPTFTPFAPAAAQPFPHLELSTLEPSPTPTQTPTATLVVNTPRPPQTACGRPAGWITYIVQSNDTLSHLSLMYGVTVAQLQQANCMGGSTVLQVGRVMYVPPWAANPVYPTLEPTYYFPPETPTNTPEGWWPTDMPTSTPTFEIPTEVPTDVPSETPTTPVDTPTQ